MAGPPPPSACRAAARHALGRALPVAGWALVIGNVLVVTGLLPLWRPSLPPPDVLVPAATPTPPVADTRWSRADWLAFAAPRPTAPPAEPTVAASAAAGGPPTEAPPTASPRQPAALGPPPSPPPALTATPIVLPTPVPPLPPPGRPVQLVIPSIHVDTPVVELHTTTSPDGTVEWETVPFVAGHYATTGLAGAPTNVVLSGHVATTDRGNVFRDLHHVRPGEPLVVYTDQGSFTYRVVDVRLVKPDEVGALAPTTEPRLTLITCAGQFDFRTHSFSDRLLVVGQLVTA